VAAAGPEAFARGAAGIVADRSESCDFARVAAFHHKGSAEGGKPVQWHGEYDVIVVGSGVAGVCAALAAAEHGLRVVVVEKADRLGGSTTYSYGLIWVGGNHLVSRFNGFAENGVDEDFGRGNEL
jgi:NADPH-dependent 2,4-dienoyl-CoA reductase/sulfur reductase-like enzyme